jgi:hypothetical protein
MKFEIGDFLEYNGSYLFVYKHPLEFIKTGYTYDDRTTEFYKNEILVITNILMTDTLYLKFNKHSDFYHSSSFDKLKPNHPIYRENKLYKIFNNE